MSLPAGTYDVRFLQNDIIVEEATITIEESASPASFPVELRATESHLQWRPESTNAWADLVPLSELGGGGGSDFQGVEMRVQGDFLQYRNIGEPTWIDLLDITALGGTGGGDQVTVTGEEYTTDMHGISPSGNAATDRANLQDFINTLKTNNVFMGVIKAGTWKLDERLTLHDGLRLRGEGMLKTIIDCPTATWNDGGGYSAMELEDDGTSNAYNGIFLSDFCVIGADKNATDNGALINLRSMHDFKIERVRVEDGSSYGIFCAAYGVGNFTNDINSDFWNSGKRGVITECQVYRGQVGIGLEGGAEGILIMANHCYDVKFHSYRIASGYDCTVAFNTANGVYNGIWIDRHKGILVTGNKIRGIMNSGIPYGGFNGSDGIKSDGLIITNNQLYSAGGGMITDSYQGDDVKRTHHVTIANNQFFGESSNTIRFLWSRRLNIQGNTSNGPVIRTSHGSTGIVGNNMMRLWEKASGVIDMGNNIDPTTISIA